MKNFFNRLLGGMLAVCVVFGGMTFGAAAAETENSSEILFKDTFSGTALDTTKWLNAGTGVTVANGAAAFEYSNGANLQLPELDANAVYRFSYKVKGENIGGTAAHEVMKVFGYGGAARRAFGSYKPGSGFCFKTMNWNNNYGYVADNVKPISVWYTVETEFSEKAGSEYTKWTVKDEQGNVLYTDMVNCLWDAGTEGAATESLSGKLIRFFNNATDSAAALKVYVDDVILERIDAPAADLDIVMFEDDFSGEALDTSKWVSDAWGTTTATDAGDSMLLSNSQNAWMVLPELDSNFAYKFSYRVKGNIGQGRAHDLMKVFVYTKNDKRGSFGSYQPGKGFNFKEMNWSDTTGYSGDNVKNAEAWYMVETEFCEKPGSQYMKWTVKGEDGSILYTDKVDSLLNSNVAGGEAIPDDSFSGRHVRFFNNSDSTTAPLNIYVDDVKLERLEKAKDKPVLKVDDIIAKDLLGREITGLKNGITPGIREITLDFITAVTEESADAGIVIAEYDNNGDEKGSVEFDGRVEGSEYIMSLNGILKGNTKYALKVSADVKTAEDISLDNDHLVEFVTKAEELSVNAEGLYSGDTRLEKVSGISAGGTVKLKATVINTTAAADKAVLCVSYFDGSKMVKTQLIGIDIPAAWGNVIEKSFEAPSDMSGIDSVQAVIWNNAVSMLPYCGAITLGN